MTMRALRYFRQRLLQGAFLLAGISVFSFALCALVPGDFFDEMRLNPSISRETVTALRAQYGLDQPIYVRYGRWVTSIVKGEFGFSFAYNSPAGPLLWVRARNTLLLTSLATLLAWLVAIPAGVWTAFRSGKWEDRVCGAGVSVLLSVPHLLLALGLMFLAVQTRWFPVGGMVSVDFDDLSFAGKVKDVCWHLVLPVTALVCAILPALVRHVRAAIVEVLRTPFMTAVHARGVPSGRRLFRHALPAASSPLISLFGLTIGNLLGASLLIEVVMSWPGLGPLLLEAILARDFYVVLGSVLFSSLLLIAGNLFADVLLYAADPRIRTES